MRDSASRNGCPELYCSAHNCEANLYDRCSANEVPSHDAHYEQEPQCADCDSHMTPSEYGARARKSEPWCAIDIILSTESRAFLMKIAIPNDYRRAIHVALLCCGRNQSSYVAYTRHTA